MTIDLGGSITIADGGQLVSNSAVNVTVEKNITGATDWTTASSGWYFIASPVNIDLSPSQVENMLTENDTLLITATDTVVGRTYDLYRLNNTTWENYHQHNTVGNPFVIANGTGYLYANYANDTLEFSGEIKPYSTSNNTVTLAQTGWNLIGNPFTCQVTVNQEFAELNNDSAVSNKTAGSVINPCAGIAVYGTANQTVTFTKVEPSQSAAPNNGNLNIAIAQPATNRGTAAIIDNAIVSFNEGSELPKFYFGTQNANIYIPQGGKDYAIASVGRDAMHCVPTEIPVNFKAHENGEYTLSVSESLNSKFLILNYLHLIDNLTGNDVDLLQTPNYTFEARTTDYESRFKLVFSAQDIHSDENFAFISNGEIIVNGEGTLQVVDVMGRVIVSDGGRTRCVPTSVMTPGVYVLRLVNGDDVKTQKIVIH